MSDLTYGTQKRPSDEADSPRATVVTDSRGHTSLTPDPPLSNLTPVQRVLANWLPKNHGLDNLGNTCFMNAGLQCLLHTTELSHFFLRGFYKKDLNKDNPLGFKGKLAESFNLLVDQMHSHTASWPISRDSWSSVSPHFVKRCVAAFSTQFEGFNQHDSQELICFLLDGIHEDLNRVKTKLSVENVAGDGHNDTEIALEAWRRHKLRNDSFVVDTFQGQMRSRVTCTECRNMSVSFDPFMYLSVAFNKRFKCAVKFTEPTGCRLVDTEEGMAVDFRDTVKLPEGFCFDCLVEVTVKESDTFGILVRLFEERCPGRRFIALTWAQDYFLKGFKEFLQAGTELPEKFAGTCVVLEVPAVVADGWWEMSGLSPPANGWLQKPKPFLLSETVHSAKACLAKLDPTHEDVCPLSSVPENSPASTSAVVPKAESDAPKNAKWYDAVGPEKPGLSAMVNLGSLHVSQGQFSHSPATFLRCGIEKANCTWPYTKCKVYAYPLDVQKRAVESSNLIPVVVFVRKTIKTVVYKHLYSYSREPEPDKHQPIDVANCFWMKKGSHLTELDVIIKMQHTIRNASDNAAAVDEIVVKMESCGQLRKDLLHVSILDTSTEGVPRRLFPEDGLQVKRCVCGCTASLRCMRRGLTVFIQVNEPLALALDWSFTVGASTPKLKPLIPEHKAADEDTPITTLAALLQSYVEEEQLTGTNQWR